MHVISTVLFLLQLVSYLNSVNCKVYDNSVDNSYVKQYSNSYFKQLPYHHKSSVFTKTNEQIPSNKVYGVSLGGWLVLEPWIVPSIFDNANQGRQDQAVDEYTLNMVLGNSTQSVLQNHWSTFYSEQDIKDIVDYGLNLVRIPIGYWAFGKLQDDPYVQGQEEYLDQALEWCKKYEIPVQIDIHGMPGSQNGFDNSGRRSNSPYWMDTPETIVLTNTVTNYVMDKYGNNSIVHSIEMVNEPFADVIGIQKVRDFYQQVYELAQTKHIRAQMYFHDGFLSISDWNDFMPSSNFTMDHHIYEIFTDQQIQLTTEQHFNNIVNIGTQMKQEPYQSIVGEFSGALTDCTKYINGYGTDARYDGSIQGSVRNGSCDQHQDFNTWTQQAKDDTTRYIKLQMDTYTENGQGWIFWCYKTENAIEWDFKRGSQLGLIPTVNVTNTSNYVPMSSPTNTNNTILFSSNNGFSNLQVNFWVVILTSVSLILQLL